MTRGERIETTDGRTGIIEGYSERLGLAIVSFDGEQDARFMEPGQMQRTRIRVRGKEVQHG